MVDTGVVLDEPLGDHDIADVEIGIQPAGHAREDEQARPDGEKQGGGQHRGRDLADAAQCEHNGLLVERPEPRIGPDSQVELGTIQRRFAQHRELLRQRRYDGDRSFRHRATIALGLPP